MFDPGPSKVQCDPNRIHINTLGAIELVDRDLSRPEVFQLKASQARPAVA